ncbi:MAG: hypothetical protein R3E04_12015 [Sphingobium sp.]
MENEPGAPDVDKMVSASTAASQRPEFDLSAYLNRIGLAAQRLDHTDRKTPLSPQRS